ncbi:MAG: hypothetical protein QNJ45_15955 [Ardenticatenaceae bacterium]|nr:hypothetical protein [Ardenticatenaceae bacterium]
MNGLTILAIFLILWGLATFSVGVFKPGVLWNNAKIQGFVSVLSERGTVIFLGVIGALAVVGGILLLVL